MSDDQLDLFPDLPRPRRASARRTDPETSHRAADWITAHVAWAERQVLLIIAARPDGATWKEQCDVLEPLGWSRQTISPRWAQLRARNLIECRYAAIPVVVGAAPTVQKRRVTRPGWTARQQTVWFATRGGEAVAEYIRAMGGGLERAEAAVDADVAVSANSNMPPP